MKYILIGTTSLNRPELHNDNIREWIDWIIKNNNNDYKFIWFINIDVINGLNSSYDETVESYKKIINNDIRDVFFYKNPNNEGNFLQACKRLVLHMNDYVNNFIINIPQINLENDVKIFWLEDDWKLNLKTIMPFKFLIENISAKSSHIDLSFIRNNYIWALAPGIISWNLWYKLYYKGWTEQTENIDPEHCLGLYYLNNFMKINEKIAINKIKTAKIKNIYNLTIIDTKIDEKYFEKNHLCFKNSYYTYCENTNGLNNMMKQNYIEIDKLKDKFNDIDLFIRICPTSVIDGCLYGRKFMEKINIFKKGIVNSTDTDFYEIKKE
jgi:hypothetical protein